MRRQFTGVYAVEKEQLFEDSVQCRLRSYDAQDRGDLSERSMQIIEAKFCILMLKMYENAEYRAYCGGAKNA